MPLFSDVDYIQLAQTFGLAVTILAFLGFAGWRTAKWFAAEIIIPLRDRVMLRFVNFLDRIEVTVGKLDVNVDTVTTNLQLQTASLQGLQATNTKIQETSAQVVEALKQGHTEGADSLTDAVNKAETRHGLVMAELKALHVEIRELSVEIKASKT